MTRLATWMKDVIVDNAYLKSPLPAKFAEHQEKRFALAEQMRVEVLGGEAKASKYQRIYDNDLKEQALLPSGLRGNGNVYSSNLIKVQVGSSCGYDTFQFNALNTKMVCPDHTVIFDPESPCFKTFHELKREKEDLDEQKKELKNAVRTLVNSVTTVNALLRVWKEAEELLPEKVLEKPVLLPAVPVLTLNKMIGLPT